MTEIGPGLSVAATTQSTQQNSKQWTWLFTAGGVIIVLGLWLAVEGAFPLKDGWYSCRINDGYGATLLPPGATVRGGKVTSMDVDDPSKDYIVTWSNVEGQWFERFQVTTVYRSGRSMRYECTWGGES